ncbi:hypothetical protein TL16_g07832 [Triparma laevis f. inornata]|uniref:Uncharacterized protein n=1 Tax=Triparma laevis f. inornata TaxID=1714386 RepID=A0A9W7B218_9STRA|nr:hypothetical protein TL16_g07832 [Triparma laevis f. inornata]
MSTIFLQSSGFSAFNTGIEWNGNSRIKLEEISERFVLMYVEGWWVVDLEYFVILPFKNTNKNTNKNANKNTDMTYDNYFYINESAITIGVAVNSEIVLTENDELDTVIWCCHNRVEEVEIIIPDEIILKTFKESIEEKRWKVLEGVGERIEWEYWEEVITNNIDRKVVEIAGKVGGEEKVVKRLVEVGCGVEEILRLTEGGEGGRERVVNFYLGEKEWQEIEWEEKVFLTTGSILQHTLKYTCIKTWFHEITHSLFTDNKVDSEYTSTVSWLEKAIFKGTFMDEERVYVGEGGVWDILEEVNVVGVVDLAIAVVMVCRKSGRRSYVTKGGIIVSVNELKRRFANYGRRRERGREKSLIVKAFAEFGEVHEAGVVVGGREGVLGSKFMGVLLAAGFDEDEAKNVLKGGESWIEVGREAGEGEDIALQILREEVLSVKDYYEFSNESEKVDVIIKFQRVWNVINGRKESLIREINRASKLGAAKMCRACVKGEVDFEQDVMVEMAKKSLGVRVVTTKMAEQLLGDMK